MSQLMRNDIAEEKLAHIHEYDLHQVTIFANNPKYRVNRRDAELWAIRDCKFLIFEELDEDVESGIRLSLKKDSAETSSDSIDVADVADVDVCGSLSGTPATKRPRELADISIENPSTVLKRAKHDNDNISSDERILERPLDFINNELDNGVLDSKPELSGDIDKGKVIDKGKAVDKGKAADEGEAVHEEEKSEARQRTSNWTQAKSDDDDASLTFIGNVVPNYAPPPPDIPAETSAQGSTSSDRDCPICSKCPEFPHHRKTRTFRLFQPRNEYPELFGETLPPSRNICVHYAAVSYCWPPQQKDADGRDIKTPRNYLVKDLDGTWRENRALDDVLDRAVDAANRFGMRMIWIDQECLPQPPEDEQPPYEEDKQLGIQAMDIVYNRAFVTAGLHDTFITSQTQLDLILKLAAEANQWPNFSHEF